MKRNVLHVLQEDMAPIILHNKVGHVKLGEMLQISNDLLLAKIVDEEKAETEEVIYTLVPPLNNPQEGKYTGMRFF